MRQTYVKYLIFAILLFGGVPWYWNADGPILLWFGMPPWFVVSVGVSVVVSILTAMQLSKPWIDEFTDDPLEEAP